MGRRGPPRKPDETKAREGNPGNKALNDRLPEYDSADIVEPPADLMKPGKELWVKQCGMLIQHGVLRKTDIPILYTYCKTYDDLIYSQMVLRSFQNKKKLGFFDMKAMLAMQRQVIQLRTSFKHYAAELGLSPASRSGVQGKKKKTSAERAKEKGQGQTGGNVARFFGGSRGNLRGLPGAGKTGTEGDGAAT